MQSRKVSTTLPGGDPQLRELFSEPQLCAALKQAEKEGMYLLEGNYVFDWPGVKTTNYLKFALNERQERAYGGRDKARVLCNLLLSSDPPYVAQLVRQERGRGANNQEVVQVDFGGKRVTLDISTCETYAEETGPARLLVHFRPTCLDQVVQLVAWIGNLTPREPCPVAATRGSSSPSVPHRLTPLSSPREAYPGHRADRRESLQMALAENERLLKDASSLSEALFGHPGDFRYL